MSGTDKMLLLSMIGFVLVIVVISVLTVINNNWITLGAFGVFTLVCVILIGKEVWNNTR